ncbi:MAG: MFS transporter [Gammaproteobacteria bacterium]|nr:MFS transporter [Gammaproteobacteria bacterium]
MAIKEAILVSKNLTEKPLSNKLSLWVPLRHSRYRSLWISNAISNIGTWMQAMAAAWLMTSLTSSSLMTASIQTATNLPIFLFALIAGTLADIVDRPKYLLIVNILMASIALSLSALVFFGMITPLSLLLLTFLLGSGAAFMWPAWQASMSGLVEHAEIPAAATLNGLSYNLASIIGPALGGLLFKFSGAASLFMLNSISFIGLIFVYDKWRRSSHEITTTNQKFKDAFIEGFKVVSNAPKFHAILINTVVIFFATSSFMSLLPLIVKDVLHSDSTTYGMLMGCLGIGAIAGAFMLPKLRSLFSTQLLLSLAAIVFAGLLISLAIIKEIKLLIFIISVSGIAWVTLVSSLNAAAQSSFPLIIRARILSIYMIATSGGLAFGSYFWGYIANAFNVQIALLTAATILILSPLIALKWSVQIGS